MCSASPSSRRVNAPAVLLWVDIGYVEEQIERYGGTSDNPDTTRSLYPYFFSPREEIGIVSRLQRVDRHEDVAA